uniref:Polysaccharide biosynthesis protein C-terminal domain-containing protein n=1 Tax=Emiliania huxleyi TaxID=2903 RepID=A0A7S3TCK9_EMIHU
MSVLVNNDEPLVRIAEDDFAKAVSLCAILAASLPSIVNNAAQPIAAALQLGLLGHSDSAAQRVAVFSAVGAAVTFVANISNFVIVVTMSRVGHALGAKRWAALGRTVWTVLVCALVIGLLSALVLWLGRRPLLSALSLSRPPLDDLAESYLPVALLRLPPLLLLRASSAVLVGYQRVKAASLLNLALACADTAAFYLLLHSSLVLAGGGLVAVGAAVAATCAIAAAAAVTAVLLLPPDAAVRVLPRRCCRRAAAAPEAEGALPADAPAAPSESSLLSLARDSLNVLVRSVLLSGSVLALMVAVAPLGAAAVGAHAVVLQLWMVTSYVVDGSSRVAGRVVAPRRTRP